MYKALIHRGEVLKSMLKKGDVILLLFLVFGVSLAFIINNGNSADSLSIWNNSNKSGAGDIFAVIKKDNEILRTINLSKLKHRETVKVTGQYEETIIAESKGVCFSETDCPDRECVKAGWITRPGQMLVCLPNRTLVKLVRQSQLLSAESR